ncbi:MAG: AMP-binding protein [Thermodesulfobacteriota bacterium]|nr:AMP-binding protein [Thermodesulfobacteriota bacterium]
MREVEYFDQKVETASRDEIVLLQFQKLESMLKKVYASNPFYQKKFSHHGITPLEIRSIDDLQKMPFTTKREFEEDQEKHPPWGTDLTEPLENYVRYHQTTGTTGKPLKWLDTKESWPWRGKCTATTLVAAGVKKDDVVFFPFAFGPHVAYWGLFEGVWQIGALAIAGGGWDTIQRIESIIENRVTVVACTPTYAIRMAEVAQERNIDLRNSAVRILVDGGEPGALVPSVKRKIEGLWNAKIFDYLGLTEVGGHSFQCTMQESAVHIIESEFIAEVINPDTCLPVGEGEIGELVLTNLGRSCSPAIRFRTNDMVKIKKGQCPCGRNFRMLDGGIIGRRDDMVIIRGMNVFPNLVGNIVQKNLSVGDEYRIVAYTKGGLNELKIFLDLSDESRRKREKIENDIALDLKSALDLRVEAEVVPQNTLEKSDYKSKRFIDQREMK